MTDYPYDFERDEERSAREASPDWPDDPDRPDPSDYEDTLFVTEQVREIIEQTAANVEMEEIQAKLAEVGAEFTVVYYDQTNQYLMGLLIWLVGILAGFMFWIWFGRAIWRWLG